jgi:hypothetical protein
MATAVPMGRSSSRCGIFRCRRPAMTARRRRSSSTASAATVTQ